MVHSHIFSVLAILVDGICNKSGRIPENRERCTSEMFKGFKNDTRVLRWRFHANVELEYNLAR